MAGIRPGEWVKGKVIGSGSHGNVHLAMEKSTGELFTVKYSQFKEANRSLHDEANFLESVDSPHVVRYLGRNGSLNRVNTSSIFMEYVSGGSLSDILQKFGGKLDEQVIRLYTKEILCGLKYIHEQGIVHCDIKCKNLLLGSSGNVKLADFGCAKRIKNTENNEKLANSCQDIGGTPLWMAPEVLRKEGLYFASDIWSLGCTVIEMATGKNPWSGQVSDPMATVLKIACSDEKPEFPTDFSEEGLDFLDKCLDRNPDRRWTAVELLDHPFVCQKLHKKIATSPSSVFDIGISEIGYDSDELESPFRDDFRGRNPFSSRHYFAESDFCSSEEWITVRSV
ncbi:mitogen-activated protein kinase kinase kinase 17-like [Mercurialis annua]|uniref:mitogen-activated protein kinase kinase kinase 17-like n=1 Tax=Mercurialis annua TaxID=3986 RepID=UPI0021600773|nr:mitogen-activated protein kinase kinase kinase 17-like [Mercurialis annua]